MLGSVVRLDDEPKNVWEVRRGVEADDGPSLAERDDMLSPLDESLDVGSLDS
jgi:hypothetical protein